jgi:hypothetical protein
MVFKGSLSITSGCFLQKRAVLIAQTVVERVEKKKKGSFVFDWRLNLTPNF